MSSAVRVAALLGAMPAAGTPVAAQHRAPELIAQARALIQTRQLDSADVLLRAALDTGTVALRDERQTAWVWRAVIAHFRGAARDPAAGRLHGVIERRCASTRLA